MEGRSGDLLGGRYRLVEVIGTGGMGRVWKAHDEQLNRQVAVKEVTMPVMPAAEREERLTRAQREGLTAAALADHPNIVTVYDVIIENGVPWTVMQLVKGRALSKVVADGPLSVDAVAEIAEAMLAALKAAHEAGVVHRDIKPANIMMTDDGRVLLTDFGIARVEGDQTVTVTGAFVGSLAYVAPERAEGREGGPASDLFSLGVTLFEAVEGTSPFRRDSTTGTLTALLVKPLPPMQRAGRLAPLITALTEKDPDDRPNSERAAQMLAGPGEGQQSSQPTAGVGDTTNAKTKQAAPRLGPQAIQPPTARHPSASRPASDGHAEAETPQSKNTGVGAAVLVLALIAGLIALLVHNSEHNHAAGNSATSSTTPTSTCMFNCGVYFSQEGDPQFSSGTCDTSGCPVSRVFTNTGQTTGGATAEFFLDKQGDTNAPDEAGNVGSCTAIIPSTPPNGSVSVGCTIYPSYTGQIDLYSTVNNPSD